MQKRGFMALHLQYELFETKSQDEIYLEQIEEIRESCHKVRKGIFAKHGELAKLYMDLSYRLSILEKHICKEK